MWYNESMIIENKSVWYRFDRETNGKSENPTYLLIDSQSVKTVYNSEKCGFDGGKKRKDERGT